MKHHGHGFTLVELLVVVAIIAILLALLVPVVNSARESTRRIQCANHMRQLAIGVLNYESAHAYFTPSYTRPGRSALPFETRHSLVTFILPFIEEQTLADRISFDYDWNENLHSSREGANVRAVVADIEITLCPSSPARTTTGLTDYAVCGNVAPSAANLLVQRKLVQPRTNWFSMLHPQFGNRSDPPSKITLKKITDGLSKSFMLFEGAGRPHLYSLGDFEPKRTNVTGARWGDDAAEFWIHDMCHGTNMMNCNNNNEIFSFHQGGCNFSMGDSAIRFVPQDVSPEVLIGLLTRAAIDHPNGFEN